jgi:hypothetical protein
MNLVLTREFSDEEIADAFFQIGPLKAPGADGFHARFFQRNWAIVKEDIIKPSGISLMLGKWKKW